MRKLLSHKAIQFALSIFAGVLFTNGLLVATVLLTTMRDDEEVKPALVIDMMSWQQPDQLNKKSAHKPEKSRQKPLEKTSKKKKLPVKKKTIVKQEVLEKNQVYKERVESEPVEERQTENEVEIDEYGVIPEPMPMFRLTETPRFIHKATPRYPQSMKLLGKTGLVKLTALIDKKGKVRKVTIVQSAGELFDKAAIDAIKHSTFLPAKIDGQPVAVLLKVPVSFRLM